MSNIPGEGGSFNLEISSVVDPEALAEYVLWPMVNSHWRGDWREHSALTDSLDVRKLGSIDGQQYDVGLIAGNDLWDVDEEDEDGIEMLATVAIDVKTVVTDGRRNILLNNAQLDVVNQIENGKFVDDAQMDLLDESMDPDDLNFKVGVIYAIDTQGGVEIEVEQSIEDIAGKNIWYSDPSFFDNGAVESIEDLDEDELTKVIYSRPSQTIIYEHDFELIQYGVHIMQPAHAILKALGELRG